MNQHTNQTTSRAIARHIRSMWAFAHMLMIALALSTNGAFAAQYTVDAVATAGGAVYPPGKQLVEESSTPTYLAVATAGYSIQQIKAGTVSLGQDPFFQLPPVQANTKVQVTFVKNPVITATQTTGGILTPAGKVEIPYGGSQVFSLTPQAGYEVSSIKIGGKSQPIQSQITLSSVTKATTLAVTFKPLTDHLLITSSAGKGGTIAPAGQIAVVKGGNASFAIAAAAGFRVADVKVNGKTVGAVTQHTITNLQKTATIAASFAALPAIDVKQSAGGSISPAGKIPVAVGSDQSFTIQPQSGYTLKNLLINGKSTPAAANYTFTNVTKNNTIGAVFALEASKVLVKASAGTGGTVSPSGTIAVTSGNDQTFNFQPASGYQIDKVLYNGKSVGNAASYTATNITKAATLTVSFKPLGHTITASTAPGGKIAPSGNVTVLTGKSQKFTITPPKGFKAGVLVDGILAAQNPSGTPLSYALSNVQGPQTVQAIYAPIGSQFAGTLTIGLVGLGESILVANSSPGAFEVFAQGTLGIKSLQCWSERLGKWLPVTRDDMGGSIDIPFVEGDNPLWFAAVANDNSIAWYPTTITYYPNLDLTTPLTPSVSTVVPNQATTVRWTLGLLNAEGATVTLYSEAENGELTEQVQMRDDGALPDEIDGDGIFSGRIPVTSAAEGYLYYRAGIEKGGENPYFSELAEIWSANPVTDEQVTTAVDLADDAKDTYDTAVTSGKTPQEAAQAAVTALNADPDIGVAGATEEGGVWWVTEDGVLGCYGLEPSGESGVKGGTLRASQTVADYVPLHMSSIPKNSGSPNYYSRSDLSLLNYRATEGEARSHMSFTKTSATESESSENEIKSDKAIIHSPFEFQFRGGDDLYKPWPTIKNHKDCGLYGAKEYVNDTQWISIVEEFGEFGYIHISSHGDNYFSGLLWLWKEKWGPNDFLKSSLSLVGLSSGIALPKDAEGNWQAGAFADDLKNKRVAVKPSGKIFLLPEFFRFHLPNLPNSLVILSACRSGYNSSLAQAFLAKGAGGVVGYTDYVKTSYAQNSLQEIVDRMYEDKTLGEAVSSARAKPGIGVNDGPEDDNIPQDGVPDPAALVFFGASDLKFPLSSLKNGGFEDGILTPWTKVGDGRVITALGSTRPTEGTYMGIISTGLGYTTDSGSIEQRMCVPAGGGDLQLDWNFFSEEWLEYVGSIFQDTFQISVAIVDENGNKGSYQSLFTRTIDGLAGEVSGSDIGFDEGGVYNTGWRSATLSLDAYAGKTVFLRFYSTDVGDSVYDSAILLDNIRFTPRSTP